MSSVHAISTSMIDEAAAQEQGTIVSHLEEQSPCPNVLVDRGKLLLSRLPALSLTTLHLNGTRLDNASVVDLAQSLPESLRELHLADNDVQWQGIQALLDRQPSSLCVLDLGNTLLNSKAATLLAGALCQDWCHLEVLNLANNWIGTNGVKSLTMCLSTNPYLRELYGHGNPGWHGPTNGMVFANTVFPSNTRLSVLTWDASGSVQDEQTVIQYWMAMNRYGRTLLADTTLPASVWSLVLERASLESMSLVYTLLKERPDVVGASDSGVDVVSI